MRKLASFKTAFLCLICTFFWGAGYPVLKLSYRFWEIDAADVPGKLLFAGIRFTAAGLILLAAACLRSRCFASPGKKGLPRVALLGIVQTALQYSFTYIGLANTSSAKSSVLNQLSIFLVVLLTPLFFVKEKLTSRKMIGCLLGFAGIVVMNLQGLSFVPETGDFFVILASCFAAAGYLISKAIGSGCDAITATAYQQILGGGILLLAGLVSGGSLAAVTLPGLLCLLFLILAAAVSYSLWYYLLQRNDLGRISISKFLTPIFGVLFSGLLLQESIVTAGNIIALILVCPGVILVNSTGKKHSASR